MVFISLIQVHPDSRQDVQNDKSVLFLLDAAQENLLGSYIGYFF